MKKNLLETKFLSVLVAMGSMMLLASCQPKAQSDCGFVKNVYGERIIWKQAEPISFVITESVPQELRNSIYNAAETWERALGKRIFHITEESARASSQPARDGVNAIYFMTDWEQEKTSEQGRASVFWASNQIVEADIRINGYNFSFYAGSKDNKAAQVSSAASQQGRYTSSTYDSYSFEALVLHELGHALGLKHTDLAVHPDSVMVTHLYRNHDRIQPSNYDIDSLRCAYN